MVESAAAVSWGPPLPARFFCRPALEVARDLIGRVVCRASADGAIAAARLCETEAYHQHDRACHAFGGRKTRRNAPMFEPGGIAYVYFVYGMHWACNVVTGEGGVAEAVLLRGAVPIAGFDAIAARRGHGRLRNPPRDVRRWLDGPGKLAQGLAIDGSSSGRPLDEAGGLWIAAGEATADGDVEALARIGVDYAGADAALPWRFRVRRAAWR